MKRVYSKPCIAVENFVLQDSIAASCSATINIGTTKSCSDTVIEGIDSSLAAQIMVFVNMGYFTDSSLCKSPYSNESDSTDKICYFTSANNLFSS